MLNSMFDQLCPTLWNPYPLMSLDEKDFGRQILSEKMFGEMEQDDVRQFVTEMRIKGDREMIQAIQEMQIDAFSESDKKEMEDETPTKK